MRPIISGAALALSLATACMGRPETPRDVRPVEAVSLLGDSLRRPEIPDDRRAAMESQLDSARAAYGRDTTSAEALIWLGRRRAYLGRYQDAIVTFTMGIERFPEDARFYRHRGHRYITTRRLDHAIADLDRAAALVRGTPDVVEPDGQPNAQNIPRSTLQTNIYYHLGLAHYLAGAFEAALVAYRACWDVSANDDMRVATGHWLYMTLRRLGRAEEAAAVLQPIEADMDVIENTSYHRLLLMYKGKLLQDALAAEGATGGGGVEDATVGYGLGNWLLYHGQKAEARAVFRRVAIGGPWAAFGVIAAESELARWE